MGAVKRTFRTLDETRAMMAVARGEAPPDLVITGGTVMNVYSGELYPATVAVVGARIAHVGDRPITLAPTTAVVDARGRVLAPGYIDPHAHPQGMFTPVELVRNVLPLGTTSIVGDSIFLLMMTHPDLATEAFDALSRLPLRYFWFLRLHAQAHSLDESTLITNERLAALLEREDVRTVGEVTRWPAVHAGDEGLLARIALGLAAGRRVEGHAPGASADRVQVLAAAGFSSDHEAITADQALARLRAGLYVMLRHGDLRPDLPALAPVAMGTRGSSGRLMLTPDGPTPRFVRAHGHMDHLIERAMAVGIDPMAAYQMATLNPATYYALDEEIGGIAPGRRADIVVLESPLHPRPEIVIAGGQVAAREGRLALDLPSLPWERWLRPLTASPWRPDASVFTLDGLPSPVPAIHLDNGVITTRRDVPLQSGGDATDALPPGVLRLALIDPAGAWRSRSLLSGFADDLGGLASSYSSGSGIVTIGRRAEDMSVAASRVLDLGGGIVLAEQGQVVFELPLPLGGWMSPRPLGEIADAVDALTRLLQQRGHPYDDLFYTLLFLGFDSLPYVRLTYRGLWDAVAGRVILPREDLR
jgi:adenine deaminase